MRILSGLKYSKGHEWVKVTGNKVYLGITDYAQEHLGGIVFVELPGIGTELNSGDVLGVAESVKAASDIYTPLSGKVVEVNEELLESPDRINEEPFESWIAALEMSDASQIDELMDDTEYEKFCEGDE